MWRYLILWVGVAAASSAVLFIKLSKMPPITLAWMRLIVAALMLTPVLLFVLRRRRYRFTGADLWTALPGAVLLALHFVTWIVGVKMTTNANATLIVNLSPVVMPFAMYFAERQRLLRGEVIGSALALAGTAVLILSNPALWKPASTVTSTLPGDLMCAVSMLFVVGYMVIARLRGRGRNVFVYVVPLYWLATPIALLFGLQDLRHLPPIDGREATMILCLGLIPTVIGHSAFQYSMMHLRSQVVAISNLGQFIFAAIVAALVLGEYPTWGYYPAALLIVIGAVVVVRSAPKPVERAMAEAQVESN